MTVTNTVQGRLVKLGFQPDGDGFRLNDLRARVESSWLTIRTDLASDDEPIIEASGVPGLWKNVRAPSGRLERVFDLPLATVTEQEIWDDESGDALRPLDEMIAWVTATSSGTLPAWKCPLWKELEASLPSNVFTVEVGRFARQGQPLCEGGRLSVSIPLLPLVPKDLSPQRLDCLDKLLADVQNHSRIVRLVDRESSDDVRSILAEVDLSGAPPFAMSQLLRIGLDAARHVVSQSLLAVELLVDPTVTSTVWEIPSVQESPAEGS